MINENLLVLQTIVKLLDSIKIKVQFLNYRSHDNILTSVQTAMILQTTVKELNSINEIHSKLIKQFKNDIIYELPLSLSKILLSDWIDVTDICRIDEAYCNEIKRKKVNSLLNNLLIDGLRNIENNNYNFYL